LKFLKKSELIIITSTTATSKDEASSIFDEEREIFPEFDVGKGIDAARCSVSFLFVDEAADEVSDEADENEDDEDPRNDGTTTSTASTSSRVSRFTSIADDGTFHVDYIGFIANSWLLLNARDSAGTGILIAGNADSGRSRDSTTHLSVQILNVDGAGIWSFHRETGKDTVVIRSTVCSFLACSDLVNI